MRVQSSFNLFLDHIKNLAGTDVAYLLLWTLQFLFILTLFLVRLVLLHILAHLVQRHVIASSALRTFCIYLILLDETGVPHHVCL